MMSYQTYNTGEDLPILTGTVQGGKISINLTPNLPQALTEGGLKTASLFVAPAANALTGTGGGAGGQGRARLQSAPISVPTPTSSGPQSITYYNLPRSRSFHQEGSSPPHTPVSDAAAAAHLYASVGTPTTPSGVSAVPSSGAATSSPLTLVLTSSGTSGTSINSSSSTTAASSTSDVDVSDVTEDFMSFFTQVAKITDHLFLCAAAGVTPTNVAQNGVTNIINLTLDVPVLRSSVIETTRVAIDDVPGANLGVYFDQLTDRIRRTKERGGRTLVHCVAGVSRSASICIAYLMKYYRMPLLDAYRYVKGRRPVIRPNAGFFRQLVDYERRLFGVNTVRMIDSAVGVIPDVYRDEVKGMVAFHPAPRGGGGPQGAGGSHGGGGPQVRRVIYR